MNAVLQSTSVAWSAFWASVVATWVMYHFGWMLGGYFLCLTIAAIISTALGIWVLRLRRFRGAAVALVALGLLIGQWWLLQFLIVMAFMKFRGFAP